MSQCGNCSRKAKKQGWNNDMFCSESCEREAISELHGSMPGCSGSWLPAHVNREIARRWSTE